jgi:small subunit ribosomal protein S5
MNKTDSDTKEKEDTQDESENQSDSSQKGGGPGRKDEFEQRVVDIRRVTRVVAGGRRFSFSVVAVVGNGRGTVGIGLGKANDTGQAIGKAIHRAKENAVQLQLTEDNSIPHSVSAKYNASEVEMHPAEGHGVIAGNAVRDVVELAGIEGISAKLISRTKNKLNNAQAALKALRKFEKTAIHAR